jgi:hypothetical protein
LGNQPEKRKDGDTLTQRGDEKPPYFDSSALVAKYQIKDRLYQYLDLVLKHNQQMNLVSRETSFAKLFSIAADSLAPFEFGLPTPRGRIFDIGPGAGFPSVVVMLAFPEVKGVLTERTAKKALFLRLVAKELRLKIEVINQDFLSIAEPLLKTPFEYGFLKLVRLERPVLHRAVSLLAPSGKFICYGFSGERELGKLPRVRVEQLDYYLDNYEKLRRVALFSSRG